MPNINDDAIDNDPIEQELDTEVTSELDAVEDTPQQDTPTPEERGARAAAAKALAAHEKEEESPKGAMPNLSGMPADKEAQVKPQQDVDPITGRVLDPIRPPASMSPELREQFGQVPRRLQQYWVDREKHIATELGRTTEARKFYQEFRDISAPYESLFKQHNISATKHARELFQLSHALNTGTPEQRAFIMVKLLEQFKPDAQTMQNMLAGQQVNVQPPQVPQRQYSQDELADMALQRREEQQVGDTTNQEIARFEADPANEFYADVKHTMGKLIETGVIAESDVSTMLRAAYDLAVAQHAGIQEVLAARRARTTAQSTQQAPQQPLQRTQPAVPRPTPSAKPSVGAGVQRAHGNKQFKSSRDAARAALEEHGVLDD